MTGRPACTQSPSEYGAGWPGAVAREVGGVTDASCTTTPLFGAEPPDAAGTCEREDTGWYRMGGGRHEYAVVHGDHVVRLNAPLTAVDRDALTRAAVRARPVPIGDEGGTGPGEPPPTPVERGDLPSAGDGAPDNEVGPGG